MNRRMVSIGKNHKLATAQVIIAVALAGLLIVNAVTIGNGQIALARHHDNTFENSGINVQTDTDQRQSCETASGTSPISDSCTASSTNTITQAGGVVQSPPQRPPSQCATIITLSLSPTVVSISQPFGGEVQASGLLFCPGGGGGPVGGATITFTTPGSPSSGMIVTDPGGKFSFVFNAPSSVGTYKVQAHFAGQGRFEPSSATSTLTVTP